MIKLLKSLYSLFPNKVRHKFKTIIFLCLRRISFLSKLGILTCKNYNPLTISNVEKTITKSNKNVKYYTLIEEDRKATKPAVHLEEQKLDAIQPLVTKTETVILDIVNCKFSLRNNHLLDKNLNIIDEAGMEFEAMPVYRQLLSNTTKLQGTVAYLSNVDPLNFYHWMCRTLPLLSIYEKFFDLKEIDFFYLGQFPLSNFHIESLTKAGIAKKQIVQKACTADRILAAISTRTERFGSAPISRENYLFTRNLFYSNCKTNNFKRKRIYVSRGNAKRRKVINEIQIINLLKKYGFEPVKMDHNTLQQQANLFCQAEAIVAPHGAALTNLLFIQPGTKVIEFIPYGYVNNCFYVLANYGEAEYFYVQGEDLKQNNINQHCRDIYVNIKKLEKICEIATL